MSTKEQAGNTDSWIEEGQKTGFFSRRELAKKNKCLSGYSTGPEYVRTEGPLRLKRKKEVETEVDNILKSFPGFLQSTGEGVKEEIEKFGEYLGVILKCLSRLLVLSNKYNKIPSLECLEIPFKKIRDHCFASGFQFFGSTSFRNVNLVTDNRESELEETTFTLENHQDIVILKYLSILNNLHQISLNSLHLKRNDEFRKILLLLLARAAVVTVDIYVNICTDLVILGTVTRGE